MTSKPRPTKVEFDRPRTKYVQLRFGDLVQILAMIDSNGQSRRLANKTKGDDHKIRVPSATVLAVKELVAAHPEMRRSPLGKRVLYARKAGPQIEKESTTAGAAPIARAAGSSVATGDNLCCGFDAGG